MEGFHLGGGSSSSNHSSSKVTFLNAPLSSSPTNSTSPSLPPLPASSSYYALALHQPQAHQYMCATANTSKTSHHKEAVQRSGMEISQVEVEAIKAKIMSHPQYSSLLGAYIDCQKVGAPPDVVDRLSAVTAKLEVRPSYRRALSPDPELDQFMEAYCNMLGKYREELSRPIQEAMGFLKMVETQLNSLTDGASARPLLTDGKCEGVGSSEDDVDPSREGEPLEIDPRAEDKELKHQLLKKYSGYLSSLRQEFSKKKKKGKLPREARQKLLNWWEIHSKWPYPSENEKIALAESTGLDQKQINNWFINQRKRHWKPSEDGFIMMEGFPPQNAPASLYVDGQFMADGMYRLCS